MFTVRIQSGTSMIYEGKRCVAICPKQEDAKLIADAVNSFAQQPETVHMTALQPQKAAK